jgi:hypothetical protein
MVHHRQFQVFVAQVVTASMVVPMAKSCGLQPVQVGLVAHPTIWAPPQMHSHLLEITVLAILTMPLIQSTNNSMGWGVPPSQQGGIVAPAAVVKTALSLLPTPSTTAQPQQGSTAQVVGLRPCVHLEPIPAVQACSHVLTVVLGGMGLGQGCPRV